MDTDQRAAARRGDLAEVSHEVLSLCLAGRLRLLNRVISGHYDRALKPLGLTGNRVTVLAMIEALDHPRASELGPYVMMDSSTLSRTLGRLEQAGLLQQLPCPEDERASLLALTPKGEDALIHSVDLWREAQAWATSILGSTNASAIRKMAKRVNPLVP